MIEQLIGTIVYIILFIYFLCTMNIYIGAFLVVLGIVNYYSGNTPLLKENL